MCTTISWSRSNMTEVCSAVHQVNCVNTLGLNRFQGYRTATSFFKNNYLRIDIKQRVNTHLKTNVR